MIYNIKAIPTPYAGVNFRSRLEARWAAFFDLCGWEWDYEPFDLPGWTPDFRLKTPYSPVLVEVKPFDRPEFAAPQYSKATRYWRSHYILLLGDSPKDSSLGVLCDTPDGLEDEWNEVFQYLTPKYPKEIWREAGNIAQWNARKAA